MSLYELLAKCDWDNLAAILIILSLLIQITPIKIDPISWIGKQLNRSLQKSVADVESKLDAHIKVDDERDADTHRYRILRFNTEIMRGQRHTEEEFCEILYSIGSYEKYCKAHPDYPNERAMNAIENVRRVYKKCMETNDFL